LDNFRANLRDLIRVARRSSELVLVVVPPLPDEIMKQYPVALDYRDAMKQTASQESVPIVDAAEVFERAVKECPDEWLEPAERASKYPLFKDWVHPSALGHELIAKALVRAVLANTPARLSAELARSDSGRGEGPAFLSLNPASIPALEQGSVVLEMTQRAIKSDFIGVWIGNSWIDLKHITAVKDSTIRLELPDRLPAGRFEIVGVTKRGPIRGRQLLEVRPPPLEAHQLDQDEQILRISLELKGLPRSLVRIWGAAQLRDVPESTDFGEFALSADPDGRPSGFPDQPFRFERLKLGCFFGKTDEVGEWHQTISIPRALVRDRDAIYFQGLMTKCDDLALGSVTSLAALHPSR
jgi:hypothetical protein